MSTNRTIVHLVAAQPACGAELADACRDLALQCLKPGELIHPSGQLFKESDDQCAHRGVTLRGGDPGTAVDVIGHRDRNILQILTVTRLPLITLSQPAGPRRSAPRVLPGLGRSPVKAIAPETFTQLNGGICQC